MLKNKVFKELLKYNTFWGFTYAHLPIGNAGPESGGGQSAPYKLKRGVGVQLANVVSGDSVKNGKDT